MSRCQREPLNTLSMRTERLFETGTGGGFVIGGRGGSHQTKLLRARFEPTMTETRLACSSLSTRPPTTLSGQWYLVCDDALRTQIMQEDKLSGGFVRGRRRRLYGAATALVLTMCTKV